MKKGISVILAILMAVYLTTSVSAFGIATPYWKENPLVMQPGEAKDVQLTMQNMVGDEDISIRAALISGGEIASITDATADYLVKAGTADTKVNIRIDVPVNATVGKKYALTFTFTTVTPGESGGVTMGMAIEKSFDVIVGTEEKPALTQTQIWMLVIATAIIILILWLLRKNK